MNHIERFVARYSHREIMYYQELALECESKCRDLCNEQGIRAIFSHRAKQAARLKEKAEWRQIEKSEAYMSEEEIRRDIVDLAGVRIALYQPDDLQRVASLIKGNFDLLDERIHPEHELKRTTRFPGYQAHHFIVRSSQNNDDVVEIQVASVFMHAWSEVEHDLAYKKMTGPLTEEEDLILDQLNGLAHAAELALQLLNKAMVSRLSDQMHSKNALFRDKYELASFLFNALFTDRWKSRSLDLGRVDRLFNFLCNINRLTAADIVPSLSGLDLKDDISKQVADKLVKQNPSWRGYRDQTFSDVLHPIPDHLVLDTKTTPLASLPKSCLITTDRFYVIYWYGKDGKRYVFPNKQTYETWYPQDQEPPTVKRLTEEEMATILIGGNVTYRPGTRLFKLFNDPKIFAVSLKNAIRYIPKVEIIEAIYGKDWRNYVDLMPDSFFVNYNVAPGILHAEEYDPKQEMAGASNVDSII